jgi:cbb3-type cytochrome oxidase maturation protein
MTSALVMIFGAALLIGAIALAAFFWALARGQFDDPEGDARRILLDDPE